MFRLLRGELKYSQKTTVAVTSDFSQFKVNFPNRNPKERGNGRIIYMVTKQCKMRLTVAWRCKNSIS